MENMVNEHDVFGGVYKGRRVLVTGHTGFKGSWLCLWLLKLGAKVAGYSAYLPSDPCNFEVTELEGKIEHYSGDVRDPEGLKKAFDEFKPQVVFHLAAQAIVRKSYDEPKLTFDTNLGGTVNVLECIKNTSSVQAAVVITSDKCYRNVEWEWGYRENDALGGDDPYSASKACAEIAANSYMQCYFNSDEAPKVVTARAGNVIGGGDWAQDRIVPDCIRTWVGGQKVKSRSPEATRPWQHVLEPLSGYLWLGANLINNARNVGGEAYNFGPDSSVIKPVRELIDSLSSIWGKGEWEHVPEDGNKKESRLLKLCCDKAMHRIKWYPVLSFEEVVKLTAEWYKNYYDKVLDSYELSCSQIDYYVEKAFERGILWAEEGAK